MLAAKSNFRQTARLLPRQIVKRNGTTFENNFRQSTPSIPRPLLGGKRMTRLGVLGVGLAAAQYTLGDGKDIFEHKFVTSKKPDDLADFYGTEDFMELFCVFPFMVTFMMRNAEFDDEGTIHAWGLLGPGELEISIDFHEEEKEGTLSWFNKKEHFRDHAPSFLGGFKLWEMTQNFGYHLKDDGTCEVYHHGEQFSGFFPVRLLFDLHSRYVIWATEKYINSDAFGMEDRERDLEEQRQNIPLHVFKHFIDGLTVELEKASKSDTSSPQDKKDIEVTLQRLRTISDSNDGNKSLPRMHTLRSRKRNYTRAHLIIDDKETKDAIKTAMDQLGAADGKKHEPVSEFSKLARHATAVRRQSQRPEE
eukprot:scaffold22647_cov145-Cylindrotheca_fusiformis.AAC.8